MSSELIDSCLVATAERDNLVQERQLNINKIGELRAIIQLQQHEIQADSMYIQSLRHSIAGRDVIIQEQQRVIRKKTLALWTGTLGTTLVITAIIVPVLVLK